MTERDRLAEDLLASIPKEPLGPGLDQIANPMKPWQVYADRLIALGWTRLDEEQGHGYTCGWCSWGRDQYRTMNEYAAHTTSMNHRGEPLDEDRLARALTDDWVAFLRPNETGYEVDFLAWARHIAKAYREDTDAPG